MTFFKSWRRTRGVSLPDREGPVMADEQVDTFPDPLSVPTPEGCEGWREMYPYYVLFSEDRAEYERSKFWF